MNRILIVESDFELAEKLYRAFSNIETEVTSCATLESATALLEDSIYNIAVIDTELSDGCGYDLIYELELGIYKSSDVRIIAIMPNDKKPEPSELMERGIDDCITKPFSTAVIKAKVFTIFTRQKKRHAFLSGIRSSVSGMDNVVAFQDRRKTVIDNYVFDFEGGDYSVGGRKVELNELETNILYTLVINRGMVIRKRAFVEKLRNQNHGYYVDEGVLAEIIDRLTHELCAENYIKIVYGIGYMWIRLEENTNV